MCGDSTKVLSEMCGKSTKVPAKTCGNSVKVLAKTCDKSLKVLAKTCEIGYKELVAAGIRPFYWSTDEGMAEVEFVIQGSEGVYPIEVKAERNLQAKSLKSYRERFSPPKCLRTSLSEHAIGTFTDDIPLYAIGQVIDDYMLAGSPVKYRDKGVGK